MVANIYPYPTDVNLTGGLSDLFIYINMVTYNWFSYMILISIYLIFASGFYLARKDFAGAMAVAGFVTFVIATLFWIAGIVNITAFIIVIAIAIIGFASLWIGPREE